SDAFVAASFVLFGPSAMLGFLVFGPMVDLKLGALYVGTYERGFFRMVVIAVGATTLAATLWVQVFFG
ncbi:MAG TPA: permease, partial [Actinomycetota bacterium]|nr:permease [Actinomycetota bacterium]